MGDEPKPQPQPEPQPKIKPDEPKPHPQTLEYVSLQGHVMGYHNDAKTRPLHPALVRLKIHIQGEKGVELYDPYEPKDLDRLAKEHKEVYESVTTNKHAFEPVNVDDLGYFEIHKVPTGWWCYIAVAHVEKSEYDNRGKLGNNGFGQEGEAIHGNDLSKNHGTLESIIIPVEDKWVPKIPDVKVDDSTDTPSEDDIKAMLEAGDESKKDDE
ncbi:hypothetical protein HN419_07240 [Candidatus Woesearchaeota archaeon]|jgi:hypothetical protein|nr:hypothetical protein [Candidatus Woesearchaeota archaeon]MBT3538287.1 hypothetical protein [Candidatus Woesearchaeota archaeon]MBT4696933.1 hypothetical protein [Candidatus Woesearchaeota archaeon]MBT4716837.1 hypothetical protein [Candidatus Woesearchaeota archaeon]MBT7105956.1 hypothetical protein [Candidatus Woesearchaeota archaeon]